MIWEIKAVDINLWFHWIANRFFSTQDILILTPNHPPSERPVCSVFWFVSSCKEANALCFVLQVSIRKPTYYHLLTSFRRSNRMFVDVFTECVAWSYWWTWCVLLIIRILYRWFFCSFSFILALLLHFVPTSYHGRIIEEEWQLCS